MPIEHRTPPTGGTAEIEAHLHAILAGPADAVHRPSEGWEQIHLAQPHPTT